MTSCHVGSRFKPVYWVQCRGQDARNRALSRSYHSRAARSVCHHLASIQKCINLGYIVNLRFRGYAILVAKKEMTQMQKRKLGLYAYNF